MKDNSIHESTEVQTNKYTKQKYDFPKAIKHGDYTMRI